MIGILEMLLFLTRNITVSRIVSPSQQIFASVYTLPVYSLIECVRFELITYTV